VRPPDLSPHGMFVNTKTEYPQGAVLKLRFRLSRTGTVIQTRGEVRYCLKHRRRNRPRCAEVAEKWHRLKPVPLPA
jgi:hypothetical protein